MEGAGTPKAVPGAAQPSAEPAEPTKAEDVKKETQESKAPAEDLPLVRKIAWIMKEVGAVPKEGKNEFFGYQFRRHEDITNKLQPALAKAGVIIIPVKKEFVVREPGYVQIQATYRITDGKDSIEFIGIGEGADKSRDGKPGDKASYKAQTGAMKYALNDLFMLAGEDPENDNKTHPDDDRGKGKQPQGGQRPPQGGQRPPQGQQRPPQGGQRPPQGQSKPAGAPQGGNGAPFQAKNLKPETVSELVDIFNEMGVPEKVRDGRFKWSDGAGDEKALAQARKELADYRARKANEGGQAK